MSVRQPMPGVTYPPASDLSRHLAAGRLGTDTLAGAWRASFAANHDRVALLGEGWAITYGELDLMSDQAALAFSRLGLARLDRIAFQVGNGAKLIVALIGCLKAGLIPLCTLPVHREVEIGGLARHAAAVAHFVDTTPGSFDVPVFAAKMRSVVPSLAVTIAVEGPATPGIPSLDELVVGADPEEARRFVRDSVAALDPFQVAFFQISGGSTGLPKIIPRFQNDYVANMRAVAAATGMSAADCVVSPGPMVHNAGLACHWGPALLLGARVAIAANLRDDGLAALFRACAPTWMYMPKPLLPRLAKVLTGQPAARARMRGIVTSNGAAQVEAELGVPTIHFYGMTEGLIAATRFDDPPEIRHTAIGWPVGPGDEIRILQPGTEQLVEPGMIGELAYRGPYVFHGYYDAPEQNAASFTADGWVRSGDLVREIVGASRRVLVFEGRLKDLISRGGEKIACEEVERYARAHPAILDIAIVPAPDPIYGERACAFIVPDAGRACPDVDELGRHLSQQGLAKFKWPEQVVAVDAFPTTNVGKLDKQALRQRAAQLAAGLAA